MKRLIIGVVIVACIGSVASQAQAQTVYSAWINTQSEKMERAAENQSTIISNICKYVDSVRMVHKTMEGFVEQRCTKRRRVLSNRGAQLRPAVAFDTNFESGSLNETTLLYADSSQAGVHNIYKIDSRLDPENPYDTSYRAGSRWFYFRMIGVRDKTIHLLFDYTDPSGTVYSYDGIEYDRFEPTESKCFRVHKRFDRDTVYVAYCMPYTNDRLAQKSAIWLQNPMLESIKVAGFSTQNRPILLYTIRNQAVEESKKKQIYIHARIHPCETPSSFLLEGFMDALLNSSPRSNKLLDQMTFHIIPMTNPDGIAGGFSRSNARGINLESNFVNSTSPIQPETQAILRVTEQLYAKQPIDLVLNLHAQVTPRLMFWIHTAQSTSEAYHNRALTFFHTVANDNPLFNLADSVFSKLPQNTIERKMWDYSQGRTLSLTLEETYASYNTDPKSVVTVENLHQTGERLLWSIDRFMTLNTGVERFIAAYPNSLVGYLNDSLLLADGQKVRYDDDITTKSNALRVANATPKDHFAALYPKGAVDSLPKDHDPGRYRSDALMRAMYGHTEAEVKQHLVPIRWCPKLFSNNTIFVTSRNNVHLALQRVSDELQQHPEWRKFLAKAQTYNYRPILNSSRLSPHSYGIAIDIGVQRSDPDSDSDYWLWANPNADETTDISYRKSSIPQGIIDIFEKHGFIWGGKWYHYDSMHFEYRPELL